MTEFLLALTGLHARNEATIQATQDWERGRIDARTLGRAFRDDCGSLVALQEESGADFLSDGQITLAWQDFLRPITNGFEGVRKGAMVRWFNTNTFYFVPIVKGDLSTDGGAVWRRMQRRYVGSGSSFKVILPDPLTFSELAEDAHYGSREKLLFAYAEALNEEVKVLARRGVGYVQLSSPSLTGRFRERPLSRDSLRTLGEAVRTVFRGASVRSGFHTCFGDAAGYLPALFDAIATDDIGFDFTQTDPESLSRTKRGVIAGVADARSTYLEGVGELKERVEAIADRTGSRSITLAPSADLRYIPRVSADEKVRRLAAVKRELGGK